MDQKYDVAAYVWPAYTGDEPRSRLFWPEEYGEWETVHSAQAKFEGHHWPRRPRWGYVNEADPGVMEMEINMALRHGVNVFIYDWYWYDNRPFLAQCLENGFLKAANCDKMKFYIMWANHDVSHGWDKRNAHKPWADLWSGRVTKAQFEALCELWIERYFTHPSYYRIDGKPVFMIYYLHNFVEGVGGLDSAVRCLDYLRERAVRAGLPGVHIQVQHMRYIEKSESGFDDGVVGTSAARLHALGVDSCTHYQFASFANVNQPYPAAVQEAVREWNAVRQETRLPFFPHVSIGWDNNPRFIPLQPHIMTENTPENFRAALRLAKEDSDRHNETPLITVNSWNEWTEGSYLEPDDLYGYGYLEAVRDVFGRQD